MIDSSGRSAFRPGTLCRASALWVAALLCASSVAALPSHAAEPRTSAQVIALPESLTKESVRNLLSRLSDEQVRTLLIEQLDREATTPATPKSGPGMAGMVEQHAGTMRERVEALYEALVALPSTLQELMSRLASPQPTSQLWLLAVALAAMLATGWIVERIYAYALRNFRSRLQHAPADTFAARAFRLGAILVLDFAGIVLFALGALALFFALWQGHELRRIALLEALFAVVVIRATALLARFLLSPGAAEARLLPLADLPARRLRWSAIALSAVYSVGAASVSVLSRSGASAVAIDLVRLLVWFACFSIALATVWLVRRPIAELIRGNREHHGVIAWLADLWPLAATAYLLALFIGGASNVLLGIANRSGVGIASVLLLVALPIFDMALCRALAAGAAKQDGEASRRMPGLLSAYETIFRRGIHIVVVVAGLISIGELWQLDLFGLAERSLGGKIAGSMLGVSIVILGAHLFWEIAKTAIDRRLQAEGMLADDVPATRLRTLLPILRVTVLVTIVVMAAMSVLAALGVDILPLLAGASVVGVAIGFGSQTLVRDIVSGAFFLMDDAFRLGEYLEIGDAKGVVEKINVRSVFLRHHRGALNILPYGEIKRLRNTSRDWQVHVMEFRLTYETSMLQVKKIVKQIGEELSADPDYAGDILQPLKSAGVIAAEDSAVVVRVKFTARPVNNAWVIRRVAYDKIIRAFRAAGIKFAHRQVTVEVPPSANVDIATRAGAAAIEPKLGVANELAART